MTQRQSPQRIEILKSQWMSDPCWDIEATEGFEAHKSELAAWRYGIELEWRAEEQRKRT